MLKTMQHVRKCLPKWTPKSFKNQWKNTPGHTWHRRGSLLRPREGSGGTPGTKTYQNQPKTRVEKRTPEKNDAVRKRSRNTRRWPKFSTAAVTPLGVFHKNSHCEVLLPGVSIGSLLLLASFLSAADWAKPIWIIFQASLETWKSNCLGHVFMLFRYFLGISE